MKTILLLLTLAGCVPCPAQRVDVRLFTFPPDPPFPASTNYYVFGDSLPHHSISFRANDTPQGPANGWREFAFWECAAESQWIVATFPGQFFPQSFFRTVHVNCPPGQGFAPVVPSRSRACAVASEWFKGFEGPITRPPDELVFKPGRDATQLAAALKGGDAP